VFVLSLLPTLPTVRADDRPDALPPPRVVPGQVAPAPMVVMPIYRVSQYAVWDYYAVDRGGYFKPRVIATPYGAFYPLTGRPYPWTTTHQREYMPYAMD
jgi:hypothetical protein